MPEITEQTFVHDWNIRSVPQGYIVTCSCGMRRYPFIWSEASRVARDHLREVLQNGGILV